MTCMKQKCSSGLITIMIMVINLCDCDCDYDYRPLCNHRNLLYKITLVITLVSVMYFIVVCDINLQ